MFDTTNTRGEASAKVFARRKKQVAEPADQPAAAPTQPPPPDAGDAGSSPTRSSCRTSDASEVSDVAPLPAPAGWRRRLDSRRTSVLVPPACSLLLHKADWLARRYMPARQRESRNAAVAAVLSEMRAYYDEVDREELAVESPDASPVKGAGRPELVLVHKLSALALSPPKLPTAAPISSAAATPAVVLASGRASPTSTALSSRTDDTAPASSTAAGQDLAASAELASQPRRSGDKARSRASSRATSEAAAAPSVAGTHGSPASCVDVGIVCAVPPGAGLLEEAQEEAQSACRHGGGQGVAAAARTATEPSPVSTAARHSRYQQEGPGGDSTTTEAMPAPAAAATADLSPLRRLLHLCGQEPHLPLEALPSMDDLIDQLAQQLAAGQFGAPSTGAGAAAPSGATSAAASAVAAPAADRRATRAARQVNRGAADTAGALAGSAGNARAVEPATSAKRPAVVKVGEGSYGEAWRLGGGKAAERGGAAAPGVVIKVVPIEGKQNFNGGPQKTAADMQSETLMCRELSALGASAAPGAMDHFTSGFVRTHAVAVCRGPYSHELVKAWDKWDAKHGSENEPVSQLPPDQLYWCIAMEDSGTDLEKYDKLEGWDQLRSVLLQVAVSLAVSEAALAFEHRDLHWGNVLIRPHAPPDGSAGTMTARLRGHTLKVSSCGLVATIIDFTNSRLQAADGTLAFCDLEADQAVFEGTRGDVQFDTYRWMRSAVDRDWSARCPETNCLWLSYLAEVLAQQFGGGAGGGAKGPAGSKKGAAAPGLKLSAAQKREMREFRKRAVACSSCGDLILDQLFRGLLHLEQ